MGYPKAVRTDQGPEFTSRAFLAWALARGVRHILNQPGKPTQNAYIESFNGKFRDECLNEHWFETLAQARHEIAVWRVDFNEVRLWRVNLDERRATIWMRTVSRRVNHARHLIVAGQLYSAGGVSLGLGTPTFLGVA